MAKLGWLKACQSRRELSDLLEISNQHLCRTLYGTDISRHYTSFEIKKKSGGVREICAPSDELKEIQEKISKLLLDCIDEINELRGIVSTLSHGFSRRKSILTNAEMHRNRKCVLNLDLSDFFDSFHFGRVRGFFMKNKNFSLHEEVATTIAKIACYGNGIPQGSPCSPVISNLIAHSLDIRLAKMASKHNCTYTRYADDITFSTRKAEFPREIASIEGNEIQLSKALSQEIKRSGYSINSKKTRLQFYSNRQDVTGLVVNRTVGVKREYYRKVRSRCHKLFNEGFFWEDDGELGTLNSLEGKLNFIDMVDKHNRLIDHNDRKLDDKKPERKKLDYVKFGHLNSRERTFARFLFYKSFYASSDVTILCEGETDNIYLKSALASLRNRYSSLFRKTEDGSGVQSKLSFFNYSKRTRFLLGLFGGGSYLKDFVIRYQETCKQYAASGVKNPVVIILDNDSGPKQLISILKDPNRFPNIPNDEEMIRSKGCFHLVENLYLILVPGVGNEMEDLFTKADLSRKVGGKSFNYKAKTLKDNEYGKVIFANKVVAPYKSEIDFKGFIPLLDMVERVLKGDVT